jgi:LCP family protein required for cell wall assembly
MSEQPPRGPRDFEDYFRDPPNAADGGRPAAPGATGADPNADALDAWFRDSPKAVPQNQRVPNLPPGRAAGPAAAAGARPAHQQRIVPPAHQQPASPSPAHRPPPGARSATDMLPPPGRAPAPAAAPARKRPWWRRLLRWLLVALVVLLVYVLILAFYTLSRITKIDAIPEDRIRNTPGTVTLIVGSDSRDSSVVDGSRTDTIMLMVDPLWGPPTIVSIPRDSWVDIPGRGRGKINSSFALGGPQLLAQTVEQNTGLRVDHYMEIGFLGVVQLTDAVGGVELCIDFDVDDPLSGLVMDAGCSVLEGQQALAFVRMRYADPKGDLGRIERQQQYISALMQEIVQPSTVLNPFTMKEIADAAGGALTVDEGTGAFDLARFGWGMLQVSRGRGSLTTVPVADNNYRVAGQSAVRWDDAAADQLFASLGARG